MPCPPQLSTENRPAARSANDAGEATIAGMNAFIETAATSLTDPAAEQPPQPAPKLGIALIAVAGFALELAVSARYGYVRDELYFLAAGHHLAFGYVDQPPLTPLLARITADLTFNALVGFRLLPALCLAALVVMTGAMSHILGAGRLGQVLAALATATCGEYLAAFHELTTTTPDFVCWSVVLLLTVRLLQSQEPRWWLAIGGITGIALEAKWNIAFLALALLAGLLATDHRQLLRSRYLLIGAVLAAALAAPDLIWQAANGWPNLTVFAALNDQAGHNRIVYWPGQLVFTGLALTPIWIAGFAWCLRRAPRFRPAAIGCAIAITLQFVLGGKAYYAGGAYTFLLAAGCVPLERWLADHRARLALTTTALLASAALILPAALPVLPARALHAIPLQKINYDLAETIGWPRQVALLAREYHALPAAAQRHTAILTGNYGEAGAVDRYGPQFGLPEAYSGDNNFWLWGPPPAAATTVIAINIEPALLRKYFTHVRFVATFWNGLGVDDDEQGAQLFIATGRRTSWAQAWPAFRHYD